MVFLKTSLKLILTFRHLNKYATCKHFRIKVIHHLVVIRALLFYWHAPGSQRTVSPSRWNVAHFLIWASTKPKQFCTTISGLAWYLHSFCSGSSSPTLRILSAAATSTTAVKGWLIWRFCVFWYEIVIYINLFITVKIFVVESHLNIEGMVHMERYICLCLCCRKVSFFWRNNVMSGMVVFGHDPHWGERTMKRRENCGKKKIMKR